MLWMAPASTLRFVRWRAVFSTCVAPGYLELCDRSSTQLNLDATTFQHTRAL